MNIYKLFFGWLIVLVVYPVSAQKNGYWDKERATKREILVSARDRIVIQTDQLPVGTTEVVYRITLLDQNQQMANSLVSVLKSIPDPTGISQGSAGAIFLLSKISGDDKCKYAIFSDENAASVYKKNGSTSKACYDQSIPISKDARTLTADKSLCILPNANALWFGFESKNWIMNQKIVLEVVPWVDNRLSSGWNLENRKLIHNQCKTTDLAKKIIPADDFCACVLTKLQKEYKFKDFQQLLVHEKSKLFADLGNLCLADLNSSDLIFSDLRTEIDYLLLQAKYSEVIEKSNAIIVYGKATVADFNQLGYSYIMTKQYTKAIKTLKKGQDYDDSNLLIKMNLAHAYMFNNDLKLSKDIHKKYKNQNVTSSLSWKEKVNQDFEIFKKSGLPSQDCNKIVKIINK